MVADVLKLTKEKVDEEIIVAFVNNSGGASLSASEIIDLQSKGVSSRVLVALLNAKQQAGGGSPAAESPRRLAAMTIGYRPSHGPG